MKFNSFSRRGACVAGLALMAFSLLATGCGPGGDAPTNTSHSTYNDTGKTAADKIGAMRAKRRPMDRGSAAAPAAAPGQ